jgi:hypothetical protein
MVFPASPTVGQVFSSAERSWIWNGSTWDAPSATNVLEIPIGLDLIKTQTIGTAVSSVTVNDAFSEAYDAYKITISGGVGSTSQNIGLRLGSTSTGYYMGGVDVIYSTSVVTGVTANNQASFLFTGSMNTTGISFNAELQSPFLTTRTSLGSFRPSLSTAQGAITFTGFLNNATSYTDFTLIPGAGNMTGGVIRVYGYRKA